MSCFYFLCGCLVTTDTDDQWTMHGHIYTDTDAGAEQPITGNSGPCGLNWLSTDDWPGTDIQGNCVTMATDGSLIILDIINL